MRTIAGAHVKADREKRLHFCGLGDQSLFTVTVTGFAVKTKAYTGKGIENIPYPNGQLLQRAGRYVY